jgi:hypothetical protein
MTADEAMLELKATLESEATKQFLVAPGTDPAYWLANLLKDYSKIPQAR